MPTNARATKMQMQSMIPTTIKPTSSGISSLVKVIMTCMKTSRHKRKRELTNPKKYLQFLLPIQVPIQGQWWSNLSTQILQSQQCEVLGGRQIQQVLQNLTRRLCVLMGKVYIFCTSRIIPFQYLSSRGIFLNFLFSQPERIFGIMPGSVKPRMMRVVCTTMLRMTVMATSPGGALKAVTEQQRIIPPQKRRCVPAYFLGSEMRKPKQFLQVSQFATSDTSYMCMWWTVPSF